MRYQVTIRICTILAVTILLGACPAANSSNEQSNTQHGAWRLSQLLPKKKTKSLWKTMDSHFAFRKAMQQPAVQKEIRWFEKHPAYIRQLSKNAKPYLYYVYQQTRKRNMPAELALLPMIESNYDPFGISVTGATGLWQMMPGTASGFRLKINWWYDGRRDIITSTNAALDYLNYLHDFFGNWLLAIAAYDSGEGTVQEAIMHNVRLHKPTDFWALPLPLETKMYVPKLLAIAAIIHNPARYGIRLAFIPDHPYFKVFRLDHQLNLKLIAKWADTSMTKIRLLNPGFRRWATLPSHSYDLLIPQHKAATFLEHLASSKHPDVTWLHHRIKTGDTLDKVARRYHTTAAILREVNDLKNSMIHVHQDLLIPRALRGHFNRQIMQQNPNIAEARLPGPKRYTHTVTRNDTLWTIAARYGVTAADLRYWNNLSYRERIYPNEQIIIWKKPRHHRVRYFHYQVRRGDSLSLIAQRFKTSITRIKRLNQLRSDLVRVNQTLLIPKIEPRYFQAAANNEMVIHYVSRGETLDYIARFYRVSPKQLMAWNHLRNKNNLHVGQELHIYTHRHSTTR